MLNHERSGVLATLGWIGCASIALTTACATEASRADGPPQAVGSVDNALVGSAAGSAADTGDPWSYWEVLQRWHAFYHRNHRHDWAKCGNGELDPGELCDDGNREPDDGCDLRCQLDDNASTPGDDRPGYVLCATAEQPSLTCGPEQQCCRSPENVCDSLQQDCRREGVTVAWGDDCDGPEDCDAGLTCVRSKYGASCVPSNPQQGYPVLCHAHQDCAFMPESGCAPEGICTKL